ncbi:hypothetical protein [Leptospira noguchii]|uniref:Uncharacterized protein n=2 Tax=Leptospira noguchii TaxID=28182 RepID=T0FCH5_9LEPT|nr:hypothetical protein LEP1GSC172_4188 [Leptospira noguchii]EQA70903.1 hypothetical protein LEP1GSC059_3533 [Leptospira noguchii serovar Panama str. CZ214]
MLFEIQLYNKDQNKYDLEIESILKKSYIDAGFTDPEMAEKIFALKNVEKSKWQLHKRCGDQSELIQTPTDNLQKSTKRKSKYLDSGKLLTNFMKSSNILEILPETGSEIIDSFRLMKKHITHDNRLFFKYYR